MSPAGMDVVCLSTTEPGRAIAARLPYRRRHGRIGTSLGDEWGRADGLVVVLAVGATVRLIAPLLADKHTDPAVVCVDDAGRYAVAVCGGHGGGNALAQEVAAHLGAEPVVTTATDRLGVPALDQLPGFSAEGDVAGVTAALLGGEPLTIDQGQGWPLPRWLDERRGAGRARLVVSDSVAAGPAEAGSAAAGSADASPCVVLRPRSLVVGVGTSSDAGPDELRSAVLTALASAGLSERSVERIATIDRREAHPAVTATATTLAAPVTAYPASALDAVAVPSPSDVVRAAVGTRSVAEAAAMLGAGPGGSLVVGKRAGRRVTVAVARRARPAGGISVVGLGPGGHWHRTPAAELAVRGADVVVGFTAYVEQCADLLSPAQQVVSLPLGAEIERARVALAEAAAGRRVALVCSGDPGVYAMASPLLELPESAGIAVEVVPGVTAGLAAASLLGAPLGHDHAVISLSDLHTPWERIAERLRAAAAADFAVVLYNPRSQRRTWQLDTARELLLEHRPPDTPVGLVTDAGRPGQRVVHTTLADMQVEQVSMTTCVVIGSRATRRVGGRMVTPRGYFE